MDAASIYEKSKTFALRMIGMYQYLKSERFETVLSEKALTSGTAAGLHIKYAFKAQDP